MNGHTAGRVQFCWLLGKYKYLFEITKTNTNIRKKLRKPESFLTETIS